MSSDASKINVVSQIWRNRSPVKTALIGSAAISVWCLIFWPWLPVDARWKYLAFSLIYPISLSFVATGLMLGSLRLFLFTWSASLLIAVASVGPVYVCVHWPPDPGTAFHVLGKILNVVRYTIWLPVTLFVAVAAWNWIRYFQHRHANQLLA